MYDLTRLNVYHPGIWSAMNTRIFYVKRWILQW